MKYAALWLLLALALLGSTHTLGQAPLLPCTIQNVSADSTRYAMHVGYMRGQLYDSLWTTYEWSDVDATRRVTEFQLYEHGIRSPCA